MTICRIPGCDRDDLVGNGQCEKHYRRTRRTGHHGPAGPTLTRVWFDATPLIQAIEDTGGISAALPPDQAGRESLRRAYLRAKASGEVTAAAIDRLCIATGLAPSELYGRTWWEAA